MVTVNGYASGGEMSVNSMGEVGKGKGFGYWGRKVQQAGTSVNRTETFRFIELICRSVKRTDEYVSALHGPRLNA